MARKSNLNTFFLVTTSFISGIAAGLLLAPKSGKKNRGWISDRADDLSGWMNKQGKNAANKSSRELQKIRKNVHDGIQRNIPDLYEATDEIDLSDRDVLSE